MSHSYIFEGENNRVVRSRALNFAKALNCGNAEPCGVCLSCRTVESGNHPDTFFVTGTKQSGAGVDDIRTQVLLPMAHEPFMYRYKVFIIDKAETLTPAAQNALLKTIEEPAPYGVFLFIAAHRYNFLPTLLSRCVVRKTGGTSETVDSDLKALAEDIAGRAEDMDLYDAFALYPKLEPLEKDELKDFLDLLYIEYGRKITGTAEPKKLWFDSAAAILKAKQAISQNGNERLAIELMLAKLTKEGIQI